MIELLRYARVKPHGLVSARVTPEGFVCVAFKRFNVENGKEDTPEECLITFGDLEARLTEIQSEMEVAQELLSLKPK